MSASYAELFDHSLLVSHSSLVPLKGWRISRSTVVTAWPGTYPLKARIHTATGPVELRDWTHARRDRASEFYATVPIAGTNYQALCELP